MPDRNPLAHAFQQMSQPQMVAVPRTPSPAEIADVKAVRSLQIRTNALQFAIGAPTGKSAGGIEVTELAALFAAFLKGDVDT